MTRKVITLLVAAVAIIGLIVAGCAPDAAPPPEEEEEEAAPEEEEEEAPAAQEGEVINWRLQTTWPTGIILHEVVEHVADQVADMTEGQFMIDVYAAGSLVPAFEVLDATSAGALDAWHGPPGYWAGKMPAADFFSGNVPFPFKWLDWSTWMHETGTGLLNDMYKDNGYNVGAVFVLGIYGTPELFAWSHKPLTKLEDFDGLNIRASGFWTDVFEELGCTVVSLPGSEVYPALERHVIDATEYSTAAIDYALGFQDIMEYCVTGPAFRAALASFELSVNQDSWDALPANFQKILKVACDEGTLWMAETGVKRDIPALTAIEQAGVELLTLEPGVPEEMLRIYADVLDDVTADDATAAEVLELIEAWYHTTQDFSERIYPYAIELE